MILPPFGREEERGIVYPPEEFVSERRQWLSFQGDIFLKFHWSLQWSIFELYTSESLGICNCLGKTQILTTFSKGSRYRLEKMVIAGLECHFF